MFRVSCRANFTFCNVGTCALEILKELPEVDVIIVPCGGGGLLSGTCVAADKFAYKNDSKDQTRDNVGRRIGVVGAEPSGADDCYRGLSQGQVVPSIAPTTLCDGLRTSLGELTWSVISSSVDAVVTVCDNQGHL